MVGRQHLHENLSKSSHIQFSSMWHLLIEFFGFWTKFRLTTWHIRLMNDMEGFWHWKRWNVCALIFMISFESGICPCHCLHKCANSSFKANSNPYSPNSPNSPNSRPHRFMIRRRIPRKIRNQKWKRKLNENSEITLRDYSHAKTNALSHSDSVRDFGTGFTMSNECFIR